MCGGNAAAVGAIVCFLVFLPAAILVGLGFSSLHATEWGLDYNGITMQIAHDAKEAGLHFLGPGHSFIRFPNTYQNMQFSTGDNDLLHTRTSDGLPLTLGVSFQYTLSRSKLYDLYMNYKDDYRTVLFNVATHSVANTACKYTAYNFFNDKQSIAVAMQQELNAYVQTHLFLNVETLQIMLVQLPSSFEDAILESISVKQNITKTEKTKQNKMVVFETMIMAATQQANQTVTEAEGKAQKLVAEQTAAAQALSQNVKAETEAYLKIQQRLAMTTKELLEYVWWDSMGEQGNSEFVIGMNPQTFLQQKVSAP